MQHEQISPYTIINLMLSGFVANKGVLCTVCTKNPRVEICSLYLALERTLQIYCRISSSVEDDKEHLFSFIYDNFVSEAKNESELCNLIDILVITIMELNNIISIIKIRMFMFDNDPQSSHRKRIF